LRIAKQFATLDQPDAACLQIVYDFTKLRMDPKR
jgi:hypothetical protein